MAYFIRDDRCTPDEAARLNHGRSERYRVKGYRKSACFRDAEGKLVFIHSAPTVMHDRCVHANIEGVLHDEVAYPDPHDRLNASFAARDAFADLFGPGHALCWDRLWTNDPERAPACYFCGEAVLGAG